MRLILHCQELLVHASLIDLLHEFDLLLIVIAVILAGAVFECITYRKT